MRLLNVFVATLAAAPGTSAVEVKKSGIVSFLESTPDSVINSVKQTIQKAGGQITHTYSLIKGFAFIAPESTFQMVQTEGTEKQFTVEEDGQVSIST